MQAQYVRAYPKINISLKIHELESGLHKLSSRFMLAISNIFDDMFFIILDSKNIDKLQSMKHSYTLSHKDNLYLMGNFNFPLESNLIYKAFLALQNYDKKCNCDTKILISINKKIPVGSGLGGGSVNGAITLLMLNKLLNFNYDLKILLDIAIKLGSDIAFFVTLYAQNTNCIDNIFIKSYDINNILDLDSINLDSIESDIKNNIKFCSANVFGIGNIVEPFFEELLYFDIFTNKVMCNTGMVYKKFDEMLCVDSKDFLKHYNEKIDLHLNSKEILNKYPMESLNDLYLPACQLYNDLNSIRKNLLINYKNVYFSGSGSSFFTLKAQ